MTQDAYTYTSLAVVLVLACVVLPRLFRKPTPPTAQEEHAALVERTRLALVDAELQRENYEAEVQKLNTRLARLRANPPAAVTLATSDGAAVPARGLNRVRALISAKETT